MKATSLLALFVATALVGTATPASAVPGDSFDKANATLKRTGLFQKFEYDKLSQTLTAHGRLGERPFAMRVEFRDGRAVEEKLEFKSAAPLPPTVLLDALRKVYGAGPATDFEKAKQVDSANQGDPQTNYQTQVKRGALYGYLVFSEKNEADHSVNVTICSNWRLSKYLGKTGKLEIGYGENLNVDAFVQKGQYLILTRRVPLYRGAMDNTVLKYLQPGERLVHLGMGGQLYKVRTSRGEVGFIPSWVTL